VLFQNGVVSLQDLLQIGVENYEDAFKLLEEVKYLPNIVQRMGKFGLGLVQCRRAYCLYAYSHWRFLRSLGRRRID